jgi:hypothetical protein
MPDPGHIPAVYIGSWGLRRINQRHPVLFGWIVLAGEKGTGKAENVEQPLVVAIASRMLEPVSGFVILRRIGIGLHGTASCQKKSGNEQREKEAQVCRHMVIPRMAEGNAAGTATWGEAYPVRPRKATGT